MPIIEQTEPSKTTTQKLRNRSSPLNHRKHHRTTTLPTEIIVEILLKLPVESLLRCKSVCKSWFSLISDPHFVKSHLHLSAHSRLMFSFDYGKILNTCSLNDVMMNGNIINNALEVVDYPLKSDSREGRVVGSCNGLLCLYIRIMTYCRYPDILFIWNPSTRIYHKLPPDGHRWNSFQLELFGFGYDESTNDYKVVFSFRKTVKMYSLRHGGWKDIGACPYCEPLGLSGKFLNGALHWAAFDDDDHWKIASLDLATETFGEVVQPVYGEGGKDLTLGTLGDRLCVLCYYVEARVDLWAMKAYGVKDSWTKLVSISYMADLLMSYNQVLELVCISNDGRILFTIANKLMIYNSNNNSFSDVQDFNEEVEASTFFESLISPLPPALALEHRVASSNG